MLYAVCGPFENCAFILYMIRNQSLGRGQFSSGGVGGGGVDERVVLFAHSAAAVTVYAHSVLDVLVKRK